MYQFVCNLVMYLPVTDLKAFCISRKIGHSISMLIINAPVVCTPCVSLIVREWSSITDSFIFTHCLFGYRLVVVHVYIINIYIYISVSIPNWLSCETSNVALGRLWWYFDDFAYVDDL